MIEGRSLLKDDRWFRKGIVAPHIASAQQPRSGACTHRMSEYAYCIIRAACAITLSEHLGNSDNLHTCSLLQFVFGYRQSLLLHRLRLRLILLWRGGVRWAVSAGDSMWEMRGSHQVDTDTKSCLLCAYESCHLHTHESCLLYMSHVMCT